MNTTIIASLLALAPTDRAPPFEFDDVAIATTDKSSHVIAYDGDGVVSAEIVLWPDSTGRIRLDANFADGLYMTVTVDGERVDIDSDDAAEVAKRLQAIDDYIAATDLQEHWVPCAIATVETVIHAAAASPWVLVSTYVAACTCLPLLVEEWEDYSCPGFG